MDLGEPVYAGRLGKLSECFRKTTLEASGVKERGEGERRLTRKLWNRRKERDGDQSRQGPWGLKTLEKHI